MTRWMIALIRLKSKEILCKRMKNKLLCRWAPGSQRQYQTCVIEYPYQASTPPIAKQNHHLFHKRIYCCRFTQYGVWAFCWCHCFMVPRFCLLLFAELFCLAIVTNSKQTLHEFEEGKKAVKFCHSKNWTVLPPGQSTLWRISRWFCTGV